MLYQLETTSFGNFNGAHRDWHQYMSDCERIYALTHHRLPTADHGGLLLGTS
jgi:hypothetical protein